jgi:hypothetical protein
MSVRGSDQAVRSMMASASYRCRGCLPLMRSQSFVSVLYDIAEAPGDDLNTARGAVQPIAPADIPPCAYTSRCRTAQRSALDRTKRRRNPPWSCTTAPFALDGRCFPARRSDDDESIAGGNDGRAEQGRRERRECGRSPFAGPIEHRCPPANRDPLARTRRVRPRTCPPARPTSRGRARAAADHTGRDAKASRSPARHAPPLLHPPIATTATTIASHLRAECTPESDRSSSSAVRDRGGPARRRASRRRLRRWEA